MVGASVGGVAAVVAGFDGTKDRGKLLVGKI